MQVFRAYKFRLFPTKAQATKLANHLEICRLLYNKLLEIRKNAWETEKKTVGRFECCKIITQLKKENVRFGQAYAQCLQEVAERLELAFRAFFKRIKNKKEKAGYPRFKAFGRYDSFVFPQSNCGYRIEKTGIKISKIGFVKANIHCSIKGKPKRVVIKREGDKWYACVQVEFEQDTIIRDDDTYVGIDLGISTFATLSDGERIEKPNYLNDHLKKLARQDRKLAKTEKGKPERKKIIKVINKIHLKIKNKRKDFLHKASKKIVKKYRVICVEDLNIKQMQEKGWRHLNKSIADCSWNQFLGMLAYKAEEAGSKLIKVDPAYTSQICSSCGSIVEKELSDRTHKCSCGLIICRDLNASLNIMRIGLDSLANA